MLASLSASVLQAPVLMKVLVTLGLILLVNRLVRELLVSVIIGTVLLGLWFGHGFPAIGAIAWKRASEPDNLLLTLVLLQVVWLSTLMAESGVMKDLVSTVRRRVPYRFSFAVLPAVIGFLPMPGGALFSAPMVDSCDPDRQLTGLFKTQINHWFRHIWEYWWPLYPGVILALELTRLQLWLFIAVELPVTLAAVIIGYLLLLRRIPRGMSQAIESDPPSGKVRFPALIAPILAVIGAFALIQLAVPGVQRVSRYIPMAAGLCLALAVLQAQRRMPLSVWRQALVSWRALQIVLLVVAVRIYAAVIEAPLPGGLLPVAVLRRELALSGIPEILLVALLPFICGFTMGSTVGMVGASFPLALSLLGPQPALGPLLATTVLAYGFGYMGELLSPVHVCLVFSVDYFKTRLLRSIGSLVPGVLLVLAVVTLWYFAIGWLLPG
jgi:integral membrane protein (TIGR00529 family)